MPQTAFEQSRGALQGTPAPSSSCTPAEDISRAPAAVRSNTPPRWLVRFRLASRLPLSAFTVVDHADTTIALLHRPYVGRPEAEQMAKDRLFRVVDTTSAVPRRPSQQRCVQSLHGCPRLADRFASSPGISTVWEGLPGVRSGQPHGSPLRGNLPKPHGRSPPDLGGSSSERGCFATSKSPQRFDADDMELV